MTPIIDAHQHFWRPGRGDYGWLTPDMGPLCRDFLPDDLAPLMAANGVDGTVLVQAAPTEAETRFLLGIADACPFVRGVVGWTAFEAPDARHRDDRRRRPFCMQAVGIGDRSRPAMERRRASTLCRTPAGLLRAGTPDLRQRLAGADPGRIVW